MPEGEQRHPRPLILIVEDDDASFTLARVILEELGVRVTRAATGEAALEQAVDQRPDLIYMDVGLPGIDGLDTTRRLRANSQTKSIPIVALTAMDHAADYARALAAGCDSYIQKPVSPTELRDSARRFLGEHS